MYSILIIDDEPIVGKLIESLIDWKLLDLQVVGNLTDGLEAWEVIRTGKVDVAITDIRMPGLSGIELIGKAREEKIQTSFIVVSGYKEFEYAKDAIRYGVEDYLLKPIDQKELTNLLEKIIRERRDKEKKDKEECQVKEDFERAKNRLKDQWLFSQLEGIHAGYTREEINRDYSFHFVGDQFCIFLGKRDVSKGEWSDVQYRAYYESLMEQLEFEKCNGISDFHLGVWKHFLVGIINLDSRIMGRKEFLRFVTQLAEREGRNLSPGERLTVALSREYREIQESSAIYEETLCLIRRRVLLPENVLDGNFSYGSGGEEFQLPEREKYRYLDILLHGTEAQLLDWLRGKFPGGGSKMELPYGFFCKTVRTAYDCWKTYVSPGISGQGRIIISPENFIDQYDDFGTMEDIFRGLEKYVEQVAEACRQLKEPAGNAQVNQVMHYVLEHYSEDLTLQELAHMVYMNSSYLSALFKKKTGKNFSKFLLDVRMEKAVSFLKDTNLSVQEIAKRVGYEDVRTFRKVFKESVGLSPMKYRQNRRI